MIIKHVEFKVICDGCMSDITDWKAVPKDALRRYAKKEGVKFGYKDRCLCDDCLKLEPIQDIRNSVTDLSKSP